MKRMTTALARTPSIIATDVTAVLVTYGSRAHLSSRVIRRLADMGLAEIVLVNNGSETSMGDVYQALADALPTLTVLTLDRNLGSAQGFAAGINHFLSESVTAYVWILDDDNLPTVRALEALSAAVTELRDAGECDDPVLHCNRSSVRAADAQALATGEPKTLKKNEFMSFSVRNWLSAKFGLRKKSGNRSLRHVEIHRGSYGGLLVSRQNMLANGLPCPGFVLYADDTEYTYRFYKNGIRQFLVAEATVEDLEPTFVAGADYFNLDMVDAKVYFSIRNHVYLSQDLRTSALLYEANKTWLLVLLSFRAIRGLCTRPKFVIRRYGLILSAIKDGESKNLAVSSLQQFDHWNSSRGFD